MRTLYWQLGRDILDRPRRHGWGAGIVDKVAADPPSSLPSHEGVLAREPHGHARLRGGPEADFVQQPVGQLPWGHNLVLLTKLEERDARMEYASQALERYSPNGAANKGCFIKAPLYLNKTLIA